MSEEAAPLGMERKVDLSYEQAVEKIRDTLKAEGFGVLTEIDVRNTLREKLDLEFRRYIILGACNPPLAHRALSSDLDVGLFLPCNVIVYEEGNGAVISAIDPAIMARFFDTKEMRAVAAEAAEKMRRAVDAV